jgi:hypothetical protein
MKLLVHEKILLWAFKTEKIESFVITIFDPNYSDYAQITHLI